MNDERLYHCSVFRAILREAGEQQSRYDGDRRNIHGEVLAAISIASDNGLSDYDILSIIDQVHEEMPNKFKWTRANFVRERLIKRGNFSP